MLNFCDFIQVYVFTTNHHLNTKILLKQGMPLQLNGYCKLLFLSVRLVCFMDAYFRVLCYNRHLKSIFQKQIMQRGTSPIKTWNISGQNVILV